MNNSGLGVLRVQDPDRKGEPDRLSLDVVSGCILGKVQRDLDRDVPCCIEVSEDEEQ